MKALTLTACLMVACGGAVAPIPYDGVEPPDPLPAYEAGTEAATAPAVHAIPSSVATYNSPPTCGWQCNEQGYENTCTGAVADCATAIQACDQGGTHVEGPCASIAVCMVDLPAAPKAFLCDAGDPWTWQANAAAPQEPCTSSPVCPAGDVCFVFDPATALLVQGVCE